MQLDGDDLRPLAVRNLTRRRARPQIKQAPAAAMFVLDGNLESGLLLADHPWEQTGPQLPGELIAAVPSRDMLAVTGSQVPGGIAALTRCADAVWQHATTRLLTRSLLIRHGHPGATPRCRAALDPLGSLRARLSSRTRMADLRRAQGRVQVPGDCE